MSDDFTIRTYHNGYDRDDEYECRMCSVVFREPFPEYYDSVPCLKCGWPAINRCLDVQLIGIDSPENAPAGSPIELE